MDAFKEERPLRRFVLWPLHDDAWQHGGGPETFMTVVAVAVEFFVVLLL
jgi:hypothetical protein